MICGKCLLEMLHPVLLAIFLLECQLYTGSNRCKNDTASQKRWLVGHVTELPSGSVMDANA